MGWTRDREKLQPEVCEVTGRLVPVEDCIVSETETLSGHLVGNTAPWLAKVRSEMSFDEKRGYQPTPSESHELGPSGGRHWWEADWSPASLESDLVAWYRHGYLVMSVGEGNKIALWADESGNDGPDLVQALPDLRPVAVPDENGRLVARFAGAGQRLITTFSPGVDSPFTVCAVLQLLTTSGIQTVVAPSQPGDDSQLTAVGAGPFWKQATSFGSLSGAAVPDTERRAFVALWAGASGDSYVRIDGVEDMAGALDAVQLATVSVGNARSNPAGNIEPASMDLRELFVVNRALTAAELALVETYLANLVG